MALVSMREVEAAIEQNAVEETTGNRSQRGRILPISSFFKTTAARVTFASVKPKTIDIPSDWFDGDVTTGCIIQTKEEVVKGSFVEIQEYPGAFSVQETVPSGTFLLVTFDEKTQEWIGCPRNAASMLFLKQNKLLKVFRDEIGLFTTVNNVRFTVTTKFRVEVGGFAYLRYKRTSGTCLMCVP